MTAGEVQRHSARGAGCGTPFAARGRDHGRSGPRSTRYRVRAPVLERRPPFDCPPFRNSCFVPRRCWYCIRNAPRSGWSSQIEYTTCCSANGSGDRWAPSLRITPPSRRDVTDCWKRTLPGVSSLRTWYRRHGKASVPRTVPAP